jgi:hypothetical protein
VKIQVKIYGTFSSEEDKAWGEGEFEDYIDYSLAEQHGGRCLAEIGSNLRNTIVGIGVIVLVAFALYYTRDPACLLGLIFLHI